MQLQTICVLGGTGFIGRACVNELVRHGYQVVVPTRDREKNRHGLILLPGVKLVQTDIHQQSVLSGLFSKCDAIINCVGILNEKQHDGSGFNEVHVDLVRKATEAVRVNGISRFIQLSATGASSDKNYSHYMRSKGEADIMLRSSANMKTSIIRPSLVFGPGDGFFPRFARLLKLLPVLPLACPQAVMAPVYVRDVAKAVVKIMRQDNTSEIYELCGPREYTMLQLVQYTRDCLGLRRLIIPLPDSLSYMQALLCEYIPGKPFSISLYHSASTMNDKAGGDLERIGIEPVTLEAVVPQMLRELST